MGVQWQGSPEQLHFIIPKRLVVILPKHAEVGSLHVDVGSLREAEQESGVRNPITSSDGTGEAQRRMLAQLHATFSTALGHS